MRINTFIASAAGISRRAADEAIAAGRVQINNQPAKLGDQVTDADAVTLDKQLLRPQPAQTILLNKPTGYITSRDGQGGRTIYDLLPTELHHLKPVGRLDRDTSGLLLLTNDGQLANRLTHPSFNKRKVYEVKIDKPLITKDFVKITQAGVDIGDSRLSRLQLQAIDAQPSPLIPNSYFLITMTEGRNRQIRRSFAALGYKVKKLHRTEFSDYKINDLTEGSYLLIK
jgi:23S rRNA pseudouridine2605 synthase